MLRMFLVYITGHEEEIKDMYTLAYNINRMDVTKIIHRWFNVTNGKLLEEKIFEIK